MDILLLGNHYQNHGKEKMMNNDLIRRSDAIKAVRKAYDEGMRNCPTYYLGLVPAVESKQGKWVYKLFTYWAEHPSCIVKRYEVIQWECSECGYIEESDNPTNYCANCGAKMIKTKI